MTMSLLKKAGAAAAAADGPEGALRALLSPLHEGLGDQQTQLDEQFFVAGAFMIAPDAEWHMLVGNIGFPPEQARLMIPIAGGHPGSVFTSKEALHLPDTHAVAGSFQTIPQDSPNGVSDVCADDMERAISGPNRLWQLRCEIP